VPPLDLLPAPSWSIPTDQELETLIDKVYKHPVKPDASYLDLGTKIFPSTLQEFYDTFLRKQGPMN